jgi:rhodanese-related sulfurtransferase
VARTVLRGRRRSNAPSLPGGRVAPRRDERPVRLGVRAIDVGLVEQTGETNPQAVFSGGSLLLGSAGRTDLLGPAHTDELTRAQYTSLTMLAALPEDVQVLPTHGAGSFCVATMPDTRGASSIRDERRRNPLVRATDLAGCSAELSAELMAYPAYYAQMAPINRAGPPVLGRLPHPPALTAEQFEDAQRRGAWVIDARDRDSYAAAHLPGSINIELNAGFASYIGWILPFDTPILLVLPEPEDESLAEATTQLIRIGWSQLTGYLPGGVARWRAHGGELGAYDVVSAVDLCAASSAATTPSWSTSGSPSNGAGAASPAVTASSSATCPLASTNYPAPSRSG